MKAEILRNLRKKKKKKSTKSHLQLLFVVCDLSMKYCTKENSKEDNIV